MGIDGLWKFYEQVVKDDEMNGNKIEVYETIPSKYELKFHKSSTNYDNVYFDINQLLHSINYSCNNLNKFYHKLSTILRSVIIWSNSERPKTIFFAIDGPSPLAKAFTQIKRREKKAFKTDSDGSNLLSDASESNFSDSIQARSKKMGVVDSIHLTTGSDFMRGFFFLQITC